MLLSSFNFERILIRFESIMQKWCF